MFVLLLLFGQIDSSAAESVRVVIPGERQIIHVLDHHYVEKALFTECRLVNHGKTAVLVLGAGHDLAEIIRKHDGWGYTRVTPKGYPR